MPNTLTISPLTATIEVGGSVPMVVAPVDGKIKWSCSNCGVVFISGSGLVTGKRTGISTVVAKRANLTATCVVTVTDVSPTPDPKPTPPFAVLSVLSLQDVSQPVVFSTAGSFDNVALVSGTFDRGDGSALQSWSGAPPATLTRTYASAGTYVAVLTLLDNEGTPGSTSLLINLPAAPIPNQPPLAVLTYVSGSLTNAPYTVDTAGTMGQPGPITSGTINWGDGSGTTPWTTATTYPHTYTVAGDYTITLTVTDVNALSATATRSAHIVAAPAPNPPPQPVLVASAPVYLNTSMSVNTTGTTDDETIVSGTISWGDAATTPYVTTTAIYAHTYTTLGLKTITLSVTDNDGATATATVQVTVVSVPVPPQPQGPTAALAYISGHYTDDPIVFDTTGTTANGAAVLAGGSLNFGNGSTPLTWVTVPPVRPSRVYPVPGTYTAVLTVRDNNTPALTGTASVSITVATRPTLPLPPVAVLAVPTGAIYVNDPVTVSTLGSNAPSATVTNTVVAWGDGQTSVTPGPPAATYTHAYGTQGSYVITLTLTSSNGLTAQASGVTTIIPRPAGSTTVLQPSDCTFDGFIRWPSFNGYGVYGASRVVAGQLRIFTVIFDSSPGIGKWLLQEWIPPTGALAQTIAASPPPTLHRTWGYIYDNHINTDANTGNDPFVPGALWWDEARGGLWWSFAPIYVPSGPTPCLGFTLLNDTTGAFTSYGPWRITDRSARFVQGSATTIPAAWAAAYLTGGQTVGIAGGTGSGMAQAPIGTSFLALELFNPLTTPAQVTTDSAYYGDTTFLLLHDITHRQSRDTNYRQCGWLTPNGGPETCGEIITPPAATFGGNDPARQEIDTAGTMVWYDNGIKRGLLYFGTLCRYPLSQPGIAHAWYGNGTLNNGSCCHGQFDPGWVGITGTGSVYRNPTCWIYDPDTLIPVAAGTTAPWLPVPTTDADRWAERFPAAYPIHVPTSATDLFGVTYSNNVAVMAVVDYALNKLYLCYRSDITSFPGSQVYTWMRFSINASTLGTVSFTASTSHATVTSYEVRVHPQGSATVVATQNIGKPTPVPPSNTITVNLTALFATLPEGVYTVTVAAISPGGTTDSGYSNDFSLPLA